MHALRELSPDQQVGLLFVILFGLLAAVTLAAFLRSLRRAGDDIAPWRHERVKNELLAVWSAAVLFWLAWISGAVGATLLFCIVSFLALREFITLTHTTHGDHRSLILAFFVVLPVQYVLVAQQRFDLFSVFIPVYMFLAIPVVSAWAGDPKRFLERTAKIQWGVTVTVYGLSHAPALLLLEFPNFEGRGAFLLFFLVAVVSAGHVAQQLLGGWLRRRPVARQISRSFSFRAWLLGSLAAAVLGTLLYWITPFKAGQALAMAFVASASGTLGEFVMTALKKDAGVRSWGGRSSVTGAVGLLDRMAALCFAAPVFFHSVRWYFQLEL